MKTLSTRGYVHPSQFCVMIYNRSLECWCFDFLTKKGGLHKTKTTKFVFTTERAKAVTHLRATYDIKLPQQGWVPYNLKHKGLQKADEVVLLFWNNHRQISR